MKLSEEDEEQGQEEQQDEKEDKLLKIQEEVEIPVGLSELEKEKLGKTFDALKEWLDDAKTVVMEKPRLEAYRYVKLLIAHLQMTDTDYVSGKTRASVIVAPVGAALDQSKEHVEESNIQNRVVVRPTKDQVDAWLESMNPQVRSKLVRLLDCFKQYLDPESEVGIDIICNHCNPEEIAKCIRAADPSIVDASTIFMEHQLGR